MALNDKQEKFAQAYVLHRNATEAAKAAGYSATSANNQGYRLMHLQEVVDRVHELEQELETTAPLKHLNYYQESEDLIVIPDHQWTKKHWRLLLLDASMY